MFTEDILKEDKNFIIYFSYLFELAVSQTVARGVGDILLDYTCVDSLSKFISFILNSFEQ